jgi:pimeloyl-ACP methyl ester carboxylesterase
MNSDVDGKENLNFLMNQIDQLLQALNIKRHLDWHLIGTSMGGVVAAEMSTIYVSHVRSLSLLNPVGLKAHWSFFERLAQVPILNHILAPFVIPGAVHNTIEDALVCSENYENLLSEQDQYLATLQNRWNYLNLISHFAMKDNTKVYKKLASLKIPILAAAGEPGMDKFIDQFNQLKQAAPNAEYVTISRTSHIPFLENPEDTSLLLQNFMKRADNRSEQNTQQLP